MTDSDVVPQDVQIRMLADTLGTSPVFVTSALMQAANTVVTLDPYDPDGYDDPPTTPSVTAVMSAMADVETPELGDAGRTLIEYTGANARTYFVDLDRATPTPEQIQALRAQVAGRLIRSHVERLRLMGQIASLNATAVVEEPGEEAGGR